MNAMSESAFHVEPLPATFGATVIGLRLAALDEAVFRDLYGTWLDYGLLIFPDQHLTRDEQVAFARRFGPLEIEITPKGEPPFGSSNRE